MLGRVAPKRMTVGFPRRGDPPDAGGRIMGTRMRHRSLKAALLDLLMATFVVSPTFAGGATWRPDGRIG